MNADEDHDLNLLHTMAATALGAWHDELKNSLLNRIRQAFTATPQRVPSLIGSILDRHTSPLSSILADARLAAWLVGAGKTAGSISGPLLTDSFGYRPSSYDWDWNGSDEWHSLVEDFADRLRRMGLLDTDTYDAVADFNQQQASIMARDRIARANDRLRDLALTAHNTESATKFDSELADSLDKSPIGLGSLEGVAGYSVLGGYGSGQDYIVQSPMVPEDEFPYVLQLGIPDSRQTDLCHYMDGGGLDGTAVYPALSAIWLHYRPQRHWNCRCIGRPLSIEEAAGYGVKEAIQWLKTGVAPMVRADVQWPPYPLPTGWSPGGAQLSLMAMV